MRRAGEREGPRNENGHFVRERRRRRRRRRGGGGGGRWRRTKGLKGGRTGAYFSAGGCRIGTIWCKSVRCKIGVAISAGQVFSRRQRDGSECARVQTSFPSVPREARHLSSLYPKSIYLAPLVPFTQSLSNILNCPPAGSRRVVSSFLSHFTKLASVPVAFLSFSSLDCITPNPHPEFESSSSSPSCSFSLSLSRQFAAARARC